MNDSLKIGIAAGLVAGFIAGIVAYVCHLIVPIFGLPQSFPVSLEAPFRNQAEFYIILNLIWGVIFGIIFSKAYGAIPGKNVFKGLCFGLTLFLFGGVRDGLWWMAYGVPLVGVFSWVFISFFTCIVYGVSIGSLYRKDVGPIGRFDVGKGFLVGAIAGLIGGAVAFLSAIPINMFRYGIATVEIDYLFSLSVDHITINALWGVVFGIVYTKVFDLVPGKGILKGLVYGLITFLMASGHTITYFYGQGVLADVIHTGVIGLFNVIVYGLVLGLLYRKPSE